MAKINVLQKGKRVPRTRARADVPSSPSSFSAVPENTALPSEQREPMPNFSIDGTVPSMEDVIMRPEGAPTQVEALETAPAQAAAQEEAPAQAEVQGTAPAQAEARNSAPEYNSSSSSSGDLVAVDSDIIFLVATTVSIHGWLIAIEGVGCLLMFDALHDGLLGLLVLLL